MNEETHYAFTLSGQAPLDDLAERTSGSLIELYGLIHSLKNQSAIDTAALIVKRYRLHLERIPTEKIFEILV